MDVTGSDWVGARSERSLSRPGARRLAAIPVSGGSSCSGSESVDLEEERQKSQEGLSGEHLVGVLR